LPEPPKAFDTTLLKKFKKGTSRNGVDMVKIQRITSNGKWAIGSQVLNPIGHGCSSETRWWSARGKNSGIRYSPILQETEGGKFAGIPRVVNLFTGSFYTSIF